MGLNTAMWTGVTGMVAHGEKMGVIGNNLANVSTVGYKSSRMEFEDLLSHDISTSAGISQVGMGVGIADVLTDFSLGGLESTNEATDLAINGDGFFKVQTDEGQNYYTRAGDFTFDADGYLVDTHGYKVQGWAVDQDKVRADRVAGITYDQVPIVGTSTDVQLDLYQIPAEATRNLSIITNLDTSSERQTESTTGNPYFSLYEKYNYDPTKPNEDPLPDTAFSYQTTIKVYDQKGEAHDVSVYYDKVSEEDGTEYWQFAVAGDPEEDGRVLPDDGSGVELSTTAQAGLVMMGTLAFDDTGKLMNMSAFTLASDAASTAGTPPSFGLDQWTPATVGTSGYPEFTMNFRDVTNGSSTDGDNSVSISLNLGLEDVNGFVVPAGVTSAADVGTDAANIPGFNQDTLTRNANSTTNYGISSSTLYTSQDGYPPGILQGVAVDTDGVLTGRYSNGQVQELYALTLVDFNSPWGLRREGGNLYSETIESGQALEGRANSGQFGAMASYTLEASNVDMATEMTDMILTQRGFQANSKVITTTDTMLGEVIQLKR
ncbi:flagellar hook protein FlgE [Desulfovibrio inopinatus]|uniref:flagellar hook protein FlgE n=1 Tax=Desulfovibrio inopinatus TaxID=102109 RepID=UPI0004141ED6|nr:flagellar hook protein FlgE [Desulfovibrio inopinatus]